MEKPGDEKMIDLLARAICVVIGYWIGKYVERNRLEELYRKELKRELVDLADSQRELWEGRE